MPTDPLPDGWRCRIQDRLTELAPFNERLEAHLARSPMAPGGPAATALRLMLDELLTNIIKYAHPGDGNLHEIEIQLGIDDAGFALGLEDDGVPFDPTAAPDPAASGGDLALEDRAVGGWGLSLVRAAADEMTYQREQAKNKLVLRKTFGPDDARVH